jgi:hypothetical protein
VEEIANCASGSIAVARPFRGEGFHYGGEIVQW